MSFRSRLAPERDGPPAPLRRQEPGAARERRRAHRPAGAAGYSIRCRHGVVALLVRAL